MAEGVAYVEYDVGQVIVEFDYNAELIEELKAEIPPMDRSWDEGRQAWVITPTRWDEAQRIIERYLTIVD